MSLGSIWGRKARILHSFLIWDLVLIPWEGSPIILLFSTFFLLGKKILSLLGLPLNGFYLRMYLLYFLDKFFLGSIHVIIIYTSFCEEIVRIINCNEDWFFYNQSFFIKDYRFYFEKNIQEKCLNHFWHHIPINLQEIDRVAIITLRAQK